MPAFTVCGSQARLLATEGQGVVVVMTAVALTNPPAGQPGATGLVTSDTAPFMKEAGS